MKPNENRSIIPRPSQELTVRLTVQNRVLAEMVESSLVLARDAVLTNVDLNALVREGKRIQRRQGMTAEDVQAFELFYRAAIAGHAEAQCHLSNCYALGNGVQKNTKRALKWLQRSADKTCRRGTITLKIFCAFSLTDLSQDYIEAANWYRTAAEHGSADEQFEIGECHREGVGVRQDYYEAAEWYHKAAKQDHANAQYRLGLYFRGGEKDGFYEHVAAALSNYFFVEKRFQNPSFDVPFDVLNAKTGEIIIPAKEPITKPLLRKLAETYDQCDIAPSPVRDKLKEIFEKCGRGAAAWFKRAAEQGHVGAQRNLALCYRLGWGVKIDRCRAYAWLSAAASKGAEVAEMEAMELAAVMSPSELQTAQKLYREFKGKYSAPQ